VIWLLPIAAVLFAALALDHFGLVGRGPRPITPGRVFGVVLILCGLALALRLF
jgi:uncharacterized membrane protein YdcZ (DUF606 family)